MKFKSISTDPQYKPEINNTVEWLRTQFISRGFDIKVFEGYGNPLFLANLTFDSNLDTVLIYGHYDVQPANKSEGWDSEPFELTERDGRLFARGAVDNKGQVGIHIATIFELLKAKSLKYNIKFFLEGDEETGSQGIQDFFKEHSKELKADFVVISDGELLVEHPVIEIGYRGIFNSTLILKTSNKDNHSGTYGGSIPNAANELIQILSKMRNKKGELVIDGIDNAYELDAEIKNNNLKMPFDIENFKENTGAKVMLRGNEIDFYTLTGFISSAEVTTLQAGYQGDGYRNAIPGTAVAKVNFRLGPNMSVDQAKNAFQRFLEDNIPSDVEWQLTIDQEDEPIAIDYDNQITKEAKELLSESYGKEAFYHYCGAIVPIAGFFQSYLKVPVLSLPLGNEDCNMHGANENFRIEDIQKGLEFSRKFFAK